MSWKYRVLAFLSNLNIGLSAPILSLMICQHGCSLQNIGIVVAVFSITVIASEIPSGVFADMYGRKLSFLVSRIAGIISAAILFISHSFILAAVGLSFMGLSTAFSSGSLDALAVEDAVNRYGESELTKAVSTFQVFQCTGLACGALFGGFLPYTEGYSLHLIIKCAVCLIAGVAALTLPNSARKITHDAKLSLGLHIREIIRSLSVSKALKSIFICIIAISFVQASLETYWQPQLSIILSNGFKTILGILAAMAYLATTLGCIIVDRFNLKDMRRNWIVYVSICFSIIFFTVMLSFASNVVPFSIIYVIIYLLIGVLSVPEQIIINSEVSDDVRASILSVTSFSARMGGMFSGVVSSLLLTFVDIKFVWRVIALIGIMGVLAVSIKNGNKVKYNSN